LLSCHGVWSAGCTRRTAGGGLLVVGGGWRESALLGLAAALDPGEDRRAVPADAATARQLGAAGDQPFSVPAAGGLDGNASEQREFLRVNQQGLAAGELGGPAAGARRGGGGWGGGFGRRGHTDAPSVSVCGCWWRENRPNRRLFDY